MYLLVGAMSDDLVDLVGLAAAYIMRYQEGCSDNLKRSIRRKAEHMSMQPHHQSGSHSRNLQVF